MKLFIALLALLAFTACKKEIDAPTLELKEEVTTGAELTNIGSFKNGPYGQVSGTASILKIANGSYEVVLDSFMTSNGPDLYVYVSKEVMPVNFIEAGKLKSTNGRQVYSLATAADISAYKYICIHCKSYNHLFGSAQLK